MILTSVILKQGQTWYALVDSKQGFNNAKFEKPNLNSVCVRVNDNVSCQIRNLCKRKKVVYS